VVTTGCNARGAAPRDASSFGTTESDQLHPFELIPRVLGDTPPYIRGSYVGEKVTEAKDAPAVAVQCEALTQLLDEPTTGAASSL
jgi:hypothetical protein